MADRCGSRTCSDPPRLIMPTTAEWRGPVPALTTEDMREVDRAMIEDVGIALMQMMENAGRDLATLTRELCDGIVESKSIVVLAGRGNNGGGGLVAARRLATWGARVSVVLANAADHYRGVPAHQLGILRKMSVPIVVEDPALLRNASMILDALIGYGLRGAPRGVAAELIRAANTAGVKTIALDVPSGLDTTTGHAFDPCVRASTTLTLALPKVGLLKEAARAFVGDLYVADIGVPPNVYAQMGIQVPNLFARAEIFHIAKWETDK